MSTFAAYASNYLQRATSPATTATTSNQPLFYSFSTDADDAAGVPRPSHSLDDADDPHLRQRGEVDPYVLDDDVSHEASESMPMIDELESQPRPGRGGWLAHQTISPYAAQQSTRARSPSERSPTSSEVSLTPPPDLLRAPRPPSPTRKSHPRHQQRAGPPPESLTESLLPRDGEARPVDVFSLPNPRRTTRYRQHDSIWISLWGFAVVGCLTSCVVVLFVTKAPRSPVGTLPYTTLTHTIPLITILTMLAAALSYIHIFLLHLFLRPVLFATAVFIPATLVISAFWAFIGSFMWEAGVEPTWGETVGLRLFSIVPLLLALYSSRTLLRLRRTLYGSSALLESSLDVLLQHPPLLALSPAALLVALVLSIPFLTLTFRLLLVGRFGDASGWEWHIKAWAHWLIVGTVLVWLWSWGVARGVVRVISAGVVGSWYFERKRDDPPQPLLAVDTLHAAFIRASGPSFGTICLSGLILTGVRALDLFLFALRRLPVPVVTFIAMPISMVQNATTSFSHQALIYTGLTGDAFFIAARRSRELSTSSVVRMRAKRDESLILMKLTPLTLTLPAALTAYLFTAHALKAPYHAWLAALLAGGITALVGRFCVGLVEDVTDTLYLCYCIDRDTDTVHHQEVFQAVEGSSSGAAPPISDLERQASQPPVRDYVEESEGSEEDAFVQRHIEPPTSHDRPSNRVRRSRDAERHTPAAPPRSDSDEESVGPAALDGFL